MTKETDGEKGSRNVNTSKLVTRIKLFTSCPIKQAIFLSEPDKPRMQHNGRYRNRKKVGDQPINYQ